MAQNNSPDLWLKKFPVPKITGHKYDRGHAVIYGAPGLTGATRLAASACARMGVGLTTVLTNSEIANVYRTCLPAHIMVRDDLTWNDKRVTARLYGSGGLAQGVKIKTSKPAVIDADALACLTETLNENIVLTPHEGEFEKTLPEIKGSNVEKAIIAAQKTGAIIVLKSHETCIAGPNGQIVINKLSSPYLATAGSGDVLAGMITGLLAQGMPALEASCAAVWIHAQAGLKKGPGLVASDLPEIIPEVLLGILK